MTALVAIDTLLAERRVWRGQRTDRTAGDAQPTGFGALDAVLPAGGWPAGALSEVLLPADGVGELRLVWPALAALGQGDRAIVLVAPPYLPYPPAWQAAGVRLASLQVVTVAPREALWATEQCLRSGACAAVLCWPGNADDRALRRLQVAAETGRALGFAFRPLRAAANPSPAALRIAIETSPRQLRVLKCRGASVPPAPIAFASTAAFAHEASGTHDVLPPPQSGGGSGRGYETHAGLSPAARPHPNLPPPAGEGAEGVATIPVGLLPSAAEEAKGVAAASA
jgi:cell division inhibitor SulA